MALAKKQQFLLFLIIIACGYIAWQLYDIFNPKLPDVSVKKIQENIAPATIKAPLPGQQPLLPAASAPEPTATPATAAEPTAAKPVLENSDLTNQEQMQYLRLMNQYQLLKMKHMLLEEEVAIATAKQKIAAIGGDTADIGDNFAGGSEGGAITTFDESGYNLVYIDYQNGKWNATINNKGHFEEVIIGSKLSDGARVVDIDSKSVILKIGNQYLRLTFGGAVPVNKNAESAQPTPALVTVPAVEPVVPAQKTVAAAPIEVAKIETPTLPATTASVPLKPREVQLLNQITTKTPVVKKDAVVAPAGHYTLQVMSNAKLEVIMNFVKKNNLATETSYFKTTKNGKPWYVLVYGKYPTIEKAKESIKTLPVVIKQLDPWVRPIPTQPLQPVG
jgi:hypothetical protein